MNTTLKVLAKPFIIMGVIRSQGTFLNQCPICGKSVIRLNITNNEVKINCTVCYWEEYYIRIKKNGEGLV